MKKLFLAVPLILVSLAIQAGVVQAAFDPQAEQNNFSKIEERGTQEHGTPEYKALLAQQAADDELERAQIALNDPERDYSGNLCAQHKDGCAGDVRLYHWAESGYGLTYPVLFIGRSGAILSGHIWATANGPAKRPGVVITTGSVQAPEELYLYAATTLAKKGYVVMTYDVQGQGRSDSFGEDPDRNEGYPAQQPSNFTGGTEDALNFLLSTPESPYIPLPSDSSGTVHSARQNNRVAEGLNAAYNPLHGMLDPSRIGIIGHSLGASAVSIVCCTGPYASVVDAVVAWDNLSVSGVTPRVPSIGMSADYGLVQTPFGSEPDPQTKNGASHSYSSAGIDTAQLNWRGGTHYEWSYIPDPGFGATWRGMDMAAWYTAAWLDKYVKGDPTADARLLTNRWRDDDLEQSIDASDDGNLFSFYFRSRVDIHLSDHTHVRCEDLRNLQGGAGENCAATSVGDGLPPDYSYLAEAQTPDPRADVSVTNVDAPDPVSVGGLLTYTVTMTNNGPDSASGLELRDRLDRSLRLRSARSSNGRCGGRERSTVMCNLGDLGTGEHVTVTIVARPTRRGSVTSSAAVTSEPADLNLTNNTAVAVTTVDP
jgi:uncharacterized repeat protein (TIGR01451 family)